jgi:hypothetical protein
MFRLWTAGHRNLDATGAVRLELEGVTAGEAVRRSAGAIIARMAQSARTDVEDVTSRITGVRHTVRMSVEMIPSTLQPLAARSERRTTVQLQSGSSHSLNETQEYTFVWRPAGDGGQPAPAPARE